MIITPKWRMKHFDLYDDLEFYDWLADIES